MMFSVMAAFLPLTSTSTSLWSTADQAAMQSVTMVASSPDGRWATYTVTGTAGSAPKNLSGAARTNVVALPSLAPDQTLATFCRDQRQMGCEAVVFSPDSRAAAMLRGGAAFVTTVSPHGTKWTEPEAVNRLSLIHI